MLRRRFLRVCVPAMVLLLVSTASLFAQRRMHDGSGSRPAASASSPAPRMQSGPVVVSRPAPVQVHGHGFVATQFGHVPQQGTQHCEPSE